MIAKVLTLLAMGLVIWNGLHTSDTITQLRQDKADLVSKNRYIGFQKDRAYELISNIFDIKGGKDFKYTTWDVEMSGYTAREEECDSSPWTTADGTPSRVGLIEISIDHYYDGRLKPGDMVLLSDRERGTPLGMFRVSGKMNERYINRVDLLHGNVKAALLFGVRQGILTKVTEDDTWHQERETQMRAITSTDNL